MPRKTKLDNLLRPITANSGDMRAYYNELTNLVDMLDKSVEKHLDNTLRLHSKLAQDANPFSILKSKIVEISKKWVNQFNSIASKIADKYVGKTLNNTDFSMEKALKDKGFEKKFTMTAAVREIYNASLAENVRLIKSIPHDYFDDVQRIIDEAFMNGWNYERTEEELKKLYPKATNRCGLIARDQLRKLNSAVVRARQLEMNIQEAIWVHTGRSKVPRPDHVNANGKAYDVKLGLKLYTGYTHPGQLINCQCVSRSILPITASK